MVMTNVGAPNHDPRIITKYYLDAVSVARGCPKILSTDYRTENFTIAALQTMFSVASHCAIGEKSHRYVPSTANQWIECFWSLLRKSRTEWWTSKLWSLTERKI